MSKFITVVGAGVAGLCVARTLLDRGADVTIIERGDGLGEHACSWWAGGMLAPFCEGESAEPIVLNLGQESADWWQKHTNTVTNTGTLVVALDRDQADLRQFARRTENFIEIDNKDISQLEPDLGDRFNKALFYKSEAYLEPRNAMIALRDGLIADGVAIFQDEVDPILLARDSMTIDCRGFGAKSSLPDLRGVKGEMLILSCPEIKLSRPIRLLHPRIPLYIVPRGDGLYMLGATMIESSASQYVTARSLLELLSAAYALNPILAEAEIVEIGVDSRPAFPDNLPRIIHKGNLIQLNGMFRHGFLLAPAMSRILTELVFDDKKSEMIYAD